MKKTFYITTPIYYVSGPLHIGHIYSTIMAWVIRNYKKSRGYDTLFLTGSDEHGQKIANKAAEEGISEQEYVDKFVKIYKETWTKWNIDYDYFSRTTNKHHVKMVQEIFSEFLRRGWIYKGFYEGLYSTNDEEYLTKAQAKEENGEYFHPVSGHKLTLTKEEAYFFKTSKLASWWLDLQASNKDMFWPEKVVNEMKNNFFSDGLEDLCVTRNTVKWGIPSKEEPEHTMYVWLDALFNYVTNIGFDFNNPSQDYQKFFANGDEIVHLLGKEISRFHFIYWPMFLHALDLKLPNKILSHGLIRDKDGRKMSKSLGNAIDPQYLLDKYGDELIKTFFAAQTSLGEDGNFSEEKLIEFTNTELVNNYGNLVSRTVKMISNSFPKGLHYSNNGEKIDLDIIAKINSFKDDFFKEMDQFKLDKGFKLVFELSSHLNKYIDETTPWKLTDNLERLQQVLSILLNGIYAVSCALKITLPRKINDVAQALGIKEFNFEDIDNFSKFDNKEIAQKFMFLARIK
ncbi:methionine--tRNA ligase [Mycoplasmopsis opalescens]|uniref:methionine--tRNA ligase n=1 Tax=Mycoplasmopsis opalescens TaxID=114886 RepID=UPI0004A7796E|nr:methionine--tRNA ligase [Mycoplasmopsis opalescens]